MLEIWFYICTVYRECQLHFNPSYIISESNHVPFGFFCSKLKTVVIMCQTWQLAVHILAHAIKWSWAMSHAPCTWVREDTSFWKNKRNNYTTFLSACCSTPSAHSALHHLVLWNVHHFASLGGPCERLILFCAHHGNSETTKKRMSTLQRYNSTPTVHA